MDEARQQIIENILNRVSEFESLEKDDFLREVLEDILTVDQLIDVKSIADR